MQPTAQPVNESVCQQSYRSHLVGRDAVDVAFLAIL
jgi:hypothetical protein